MPVNKSVHYSKCQLLIEEREKKSTEGMVEKVQWVSLEMRICDVDPFLAVSLLNALACGTPTGTQNFAALIGGASYLRLYPLM